MNESFKLKIEEVKLSKKHQVNIQSWFDDFTSFSDLFLSNFSIKYSQKDKTFTFSCCKSFMFVSYLY